jgi:hypothetical protein
MTRATTIASSTYKAMFFRSLLVAAAGASRRRIGLDHALREEHQPGKKTKESNQEEEHEHDLEHVRPFDSQKYDITPLRVR